MNDCAKTHEAECAGSQGRRKRARSEILRLRAHAEELETRVLLLKRFCEPATRRPTQDATAFVAGSEPSNRREAAAAAASASAWFQAAAEELSALQKSQRRNRELKREVEEQQKTSAALKELFRHQLSQEVRVACCLVC